MAKQGQAGFKSNALKPKVKLEKINWRVVLVAVLITALVWAAWAYLGSRTNQAVYLKQLKIKDTELTAKLEELNKSTQTTQQLQETKLKLEAEKVELEKQLQAKAKNKVYAASNVITAPLKATTGNCGDWMGQAGIPLTNATRTLILNESGCKWWAKNPKSGACGIPQAHPCSKLPCPLTEAGAVCQLKWMAGYVKDRYGSWEQALSFWYAQCPTKKGCWY